MSGWCGSCGPGGSALATAGLKTIAAEQAIPTTRRHITLKFIPYTPLECAARDRHVGEAGAAVATVADAVNAAIAIAVAKPVSLVQFIRGFSLPATGAPC
jgi:hypothetical protein